MAVFPTALNGTLDASSVAPNPTSNLYKTENAIGIAQTRPKSTRRVSRYNGLRYIVDITQLNAFRQFVNEDLRYGSLPFDMTDPVSGLVTEYKLVDGVYNTKWLGLDKWEIKISVEFKE